MEHRCGGEGGSIAGAIAAPVASPRGKRRRWSRQRRRRCVGLDRRLMRPWRNAPEVLTTILPQPFIAIHLSVVRELTYRVSRRGRHPQSDPARASLPAIGGVHVGFPIALVIAVATWWILYRTTEGLRLRATGFNPEASRYAGINVGAQLMRAMAISGAMAGLAGGIELLGVTHRLFERFAAGYGYSGIAVALLAQLHPLACIASAFFFRRASRPALASCSAPRTFLPRSRPSGQGHIVILVLIALHASMRARDA